jgi:hypothetical protein
MRDSKLSNCCAIFVLTSVLLLSFSSTAFSQGFSINGTQQANSTQKWRDNSGDLEGMSTGTVVLIGAGIAAAVVGVLLLVNSGSDDSTGDNSGEGTEEKVDTEKNSSNQLEDTPMSVVQNNLRIGYTEYAEQQIPLNIYLSMKQNNLQFSDNTFEIGLALNF